MKKKWIKTLVNTTRSLRLLEQDHLDC